MPKRKPKTSIEERTASIMQFLKANPRLVQVAEGALQESTAVLQVACTMYRQVKQFPEAMRMAQAEGHTEVAQWLRENACPQTE